MCRNHLVVLGALVSWVLWLPLDPFPYCLGQWEYPRWDPAKLPLPQNLPKASSLLWRWSKIRLWLAWCGGTMQWKAPSPVMATDQFFLPSPCILAVLVHLLSLLLQVQEIHSWFNELTQQRCIFLTSRRDKEKWDKKFTVWRSKSTTTVQGDTCYVKCVHSMHGYAEGRGLLQPGEHIKGLGWLSQGGDAWSEVSWEVRKGHSVHSFINYLFSTC